MKKNPHAVALGRRGGRAGRGAAKARKPWPKRNCMVCGRLMRIIDIKGDARKTVTYFCGNCNAGWKVDL